MFIIPEIKYKKSLAEFIEHISATCSDGEWIFRGQGGGGWPTPRIARGLAAKSAPRVLERKLLAEFLNRLPAVHPKTLSSVWEALALMQHYGGITRLLDWTRNPLVALWFALNSFLSTSKKGRKNGPSVWGLTVQPTEWLPLNAEDALLEKLETVRFLNPPHFDARIAAQESVFSVHPLPTSTLANLQAPKCWEDRKIIQVHFEPDKALNIQLQLERCGFRTDTIYPDIQGLCARLAEQYTRAKNTTLIATSVAIRWSSSKAAK